MPARDGPSGWGQEGERHREGDARWSELGTFIRDQRRSVRLSLRQLAKRSGISNPYLSQIERGIRRPSADILQQLARALQISCETLYVHAGILDRSSRDEPDDVASVLDRDPYLDDKQKRALLRTYWAYRRDNGAGLAEPTVRSGGVAKHE
jgi:transcriptional regulator with XRE-family HTH domain